MALVYQSARRHKPDSTPSHFLIRTISKSRLIQHKMFPWSVKINWKEYGRERIAYNLMLWLNICLEWLKNTTKHLGHDCLSANQNTCMNPEICVLVSRNTPATVILRLLLLRMKLGEPFDGRNTDRSCLRAYVGETLWKWSDEPENWDKCTKTREDLFFWPYTDYLTPRNRVHMQKLVFLELDKKLSAFYPGSLPCLQKPATIYLEPQ